MNIDELIDLLTKRRSIRRFRSDPIPDGQIEKIIEAARWAPSGANAQPWEFIIVKDQGTKEKIARLHNDTYQEEHECMEELRIEEFRHHQVATSSHSLPGFKDAPVLVVVCGDRRTLQASTIAARYIGTEGGSGDSTYLKNMANATFSLLLAATGLGLGCQWLSVSTYMEQLLKPLLDIPPILQIHTMVAIGHPAYEPKPSYRRDLREIVHYEKYDRSRFRTGRQIVQYLRELRAKTRANYDQGKPTR
jgi:5,6-dimethylbenzimidazole synthase